MSVAEMIEISASPGESFGEADRTGPAEAVSGTDGIQDARTDEQSVRVDGSGRISELRVNMRVAFVVDRAA